MNKKLGVFWCVSGISVWFASICNSAAADVDDLLCRMTLEEKIGQLTQYSGSVEVTGPVMGNDSQLEGIREGKVGSVLNIHGIEAAKALQQMALESRLGIPLVFGMDVIHGFRHLFPIPLAEAASFDLTLIESSARWSAREAAENGLNWTFAPMVDVCRDARWGRVMEGAGEDPWWGAQVARARVRGFQGDDLSRPDTILACAKHFAGYGFANAGLDYDWVDVSGNVLQNVILPPFRAAIDAGAGTVMSAFHLLNGIPCTGNEGLLRGILKETLGFEGFVVSDWNSIGELVVHGGAIDGVDAARWAISAGCDMDMVSGLYETHLAALVAEGQIGEGLIDEAVLRVLKAKQALGLFEDPFRYLKASETLDVDALRVSARELAARCIVLLKNESGCLPLSDSAPHILVVGELAASRWDMLGGWSCMGDDRSVVTLLDALRQRFGEDRVSYLPKLDDENEWRNLAEKSDLIVCAIGEHAAESGEASSKTDIVISKDQQRFVQLLKSSGKPIATLVMGGRPQIFEQAADASDAVLVTWWLGCEAGNAIVDVLTGKVNPSGKLPISFPAHVGQLPMSYQQYNSGRPGDPGQRYVTQYLDGSREPAYAFGFGLSYTTFEIGEPSLSSDQLHPGETVTLSVEIRNSGDKAGRETLQLYVHDVSSRIVRPMKELKGIRQVQLEPGESKTVAFEIGDRELGYYDSNGQWFIEPGRFDLIIGVDSRGGRKVSIWVVEFGK